MNWLSKFQESLNKVETIKLYRGGSHGSQGHYWSTDREWARQFTHSGLDSEIKELEVTKDNILILNPLPSANSENDISSGIEKAHSGGFIGFLVSEGKDQPNSVFLLKTVKGN
jgi:hypothetical protein